MFYSYILESKRKSHTRYIGHTANLRRRLEQHNVGENRSTARQRPWKLKLCIAFEIRKLASEFERYLKSGSGHSFANRHF